MATFAHDMIEDEVDFGFTVSEAPNGMCIVVIQLGRGLRAVKMRESDGAVRYQVFDEAFAPLYTSACSLEELRSRFIVARSE